MINNMEYLINQLKKEWEFSKEGRKKVIIKKEHAMMFIDDICVLVSDIKDYLEISEDDMDFKENIEIVKRIYVVLRLGSKIRKAILETKDNREIMLVLDKEEYRMYNEYFTEIK